MLTSAASCWLDASTGSSINAKLSDSRAPDAVDACAHDVHKQMFAALITDAANIVCWNLTYVERTQAVIVQTCQRAFNPPGMEHSNPASLAMLAAFKPCQGASSAGMVGCWAFEPCQ
jgi:hypothetical protein